ncbi:MAG: exo-alpha-sialidase [Anaerolineae bacterium]
MMLNQEQKKRLIAFGQKLIDQEKCKVIVSANQPKSGFWFGGGNLSQGADGKLYLIGRYRNFGDSRTGLGMGERGLELSIFCSNDRGQSFEKVLSMNKADLTRQHTAGWETLSIEGAALHFTSNGVELFVSSEKKIGYPDALAGYLKPGSGRWTIEHARAKSIQELELAPFKTIIENDDARWLHPKDPFFRSQPNGDLLLGFVTHPFNWAGSNSGYAVRRAGENHFDPAVFDFFPTGLTWDIAISRITSWLPLPQVGVLADGVSRTLVFYDGGESMRDLDEHKSAMSRPRGYSCEELGGLAVADESGTADFERLSILGPDFVSPHGTGCSRYVDVLETAEGYYATWQQSQPDFSQPLVMNFVSKEEVEHLLL